MSNIKEEILSHIKNKYKKHKKLEKIISKVKKELKIMDSTDGLEDKNNLVSFYDIWKDCNEVGKENKINSWTAYFLGITNKKPDGDFLPERRVFARAGFPDIDTDFDYERRDEIYEYIIDKYGRDKVGNIGTHGVLKFKSCVTRVTKALDLADSFHKGKDKYISDNAAKVTEILSSFPKGGLIKVKDKNGESHIIKTFKEAYDHSSDFRFYVDKYKDENFYEHLENIEGVFANSGVHASGVCCSNVPLEEIAPLRTAKGGVLATQFAYEDLEEIGLIKFDILALSSLSVIRRTLERIKDYWNIDIDIENIPMNDEKTFELYRTGNLGGVFQCENGGMQKTMKDIKVDCFNDIVAAVALYRPGPMDNIPEYCARKHGEKEISYFHSSIEKFIKPYIKDTYAIAIYQEQIMQICNSLAGFSISDGYVMIKAIGKKKEFLMHKFKDQFVEGCVKNEVPKNIAEQYWEKFIIPFASYGFNKAHAVAYGLLSMQSCYLKSHYPDEFICALLDVTVNSSVGDKHEKIEEFEKEFKRKMSIKFLPRDINKCKFMYTVEKRKDKKEGVDKTEIRPSLLCKGVGFNVAEEIDKHQPFKNMKDLVERTDSSIVDTRSIEAFALNGYFGTKNISRAKEIVKDFLMIREDMKKIAKKGVESIDMFE